MSEEREAAIARENARLRNFSDRWHVNMSDSALARFLQQRRYDVTIPPERSVEDIAQARDLARSSALAQRAPGFAAARSLIEFARSPVVPIDANLEPTGTPLTSVGQAFAWYSEHQDDGAAVIASAGILAVRIESWSSWSTWLRLHDLEVRTPLDPDRPEEARFSVRQEPRPYGWPARLEWWAPQPQQPRQPHPPIPFRGDREGRELWGRMTAPLRQDPGGFLLWACPTDLTFRARGLAPGLWVVASEAVVPYFAVRDGLTLTRVSGGFTDCDPSKMAPAWLLAEIGATIVQRAAARLRRRTAKKPAKPRDSILNTVAEPSRRAAPESWREYPQGD